MLHTSFCIESGVLPYLPTIMDKFFITYTSCHSSVSTSKSVLFCLSVILSLSQAIHVKELVLSGIGALG